MSGARLVVAVAVVALAGLPSLGCTTMRWMFDDWTYELGDSYHENTQKMIANPEVVDAASQQPGPMDGATAEQVMESYRERQAKAPEVRGPSIINIGTGSTK